MKCTANEDFRVGRDLIEAGNTVDSAKRGWSDAQVERYWDNGWIEVEGWDKAPERKPGAKTVRADKPVHKSKEG